MVLTEFNKNCYAVFTFHNEHCLSEHRQKFPMSVNLVSNRTRRAPPEYAAQSVIYTCVLNLHLKSKVREREREIKVTVDKVVGGVRDTLF
jgi:hypothetical protein